MPGRIIFERREGTYGQVKLEDCESWPQTRLRWQVDPSRWEGPDEAPEPPVLDLTTIWQKQPSPTLYRTPQGEYFATLREPGDPNATVADLPCSNRPPRYFAWSRQAGDAWLRFNGFTDSTGSAAAPSEDSRDPQAPAEPTPPAPESETVENRALAMALRMIQTGEKLSIATIAKSLGCQRTYLYRCPRFQDFIKAYKNGPESLPRGRKDRKTGTLEAWHEGD